MVASEESSPALSPPAAAALLAEADAAYARCKPLCPPLWVLVLKGDSEKEFAARDIISQHAQRSLDTWQPQIGKERLPAQRRCFEKLLAKCAAGSEICDTCDRVVAGAQVVPLRVGCCCAHAACCQLDVPAVGLPVAVGFSWSYGGWVRTCSRLN